MSFLADLPCTNPNNFSKTEGSSKTIGDTANPAKVAHSVPIRPDEKTISNDKKPYILRYLEKQWGAKFCNIGISEADFVFLYQFLFTKYKLCPNYFRYQ
uniref:DDA1 domain-containing protein n=1 Tax=Heterorhabditis bacteriophora TaxID=37862 RepID=A0A1I7WX84_HETBA